MQPSVQDEAYPRQNARQPFDPLDAAWRWGVSPWLALGLAVAGFLFVVTAALVPQAPVESSVDPAGYARWVAALSPAWQARAVALERTGLSHLFRSAAFRLYLTLLGLHLCLALADRLGNALHGWRKAQGVASEPAATWAYRASLPRPEGWESALHSWGWFPLKKVAGDKEGSRQAFFWRIPWEALAYAGGVLVLAGAVWTIRWGWSLQPFPLAPGRTATLQSDGAEVVARLDALYPRGEGRVGYGGLFTLLDPDSGEPLAAGPLPAGPPLSARGIWLRLRAIAPMVTVKALDQDGEPLGIQGFPAGAADETELILFFSDDQREQTFVIPSRRLGGRLVQESRGREGPDYRLEVYQGTDARPSLTADVSETGLVEMEDVDLYLYLGWYGWFVAHRHPGAAVLMVGLALISVGVAAVVNGFGCTLALEPPPGSSEGETLLGVPAGRSGWTRNGFARFVRWATAGAKSGSRWRRLLLDVGLLALGGGVVWALAWGLPTAGPAGEWSSVWTVAGGLLVVAGWAGFAFSLVPAALSLWNRGESFATAQTWTEWLQEAGWRWLTGGLAVGAVGNWLQLGEFWMEGARQLCPLALWTLGLAASFFCQAVRRDDGLCGKVLGGLGLAAWVLGLLWAWCVWG